MKIRILFAILFIACFGKKGITQSADSIKLDFNHIFFCVDSITYENLYKHEFLKEIFAYTRESSGKTLTDSWTGKYILGQRSYVEVFNANSYKGNSPQLGDKFGDLAIVFKPQRQGDIKKIEERIRNNNEASTLKLNEIESDGKVIPFTYDLYLSNAELQETFRPYANERTIEFLKLSGFNEDEIKSGISYQQFADKRRGKKYEKLYNDIEKIELILTNKEFKYLAETLKYFGFSQSGHRFINNGFEISCSVRQNRKYKLKAIHFTLLNKTDDIKIEISKNLTFKASGVKASFQFNYQ